MKYFVSYSITTPEKFIGFENDVIEMDGILPAEELDRVKQLESKILDKLLPLADSLILTHSKTISVTVINYKEIRLPWKSTGEFERYTYITENKNKIDIVIEKALIFANEYCYKIQIVQNNLIRQDLLLEDQKS